MHHFFLKEISLKPGELFIIKDKDIVHQIRKVLRLKSGEVFKAINDTGYKFNCLLKKVDKQYILFEVCDKIFCQKPLKKVTVAQSLTKKKEKLELVIQKCTELGAYAFRFLQSDKSKVKYTPNFERLKKIATEATEQSQRCYRPIIFNEIINPAEIDKTYPNTFKIFLDTNQENSVPIFPILPNLKFHNDILICVGPEEGWSDFERDLAKNSNWNIISINDGILRSETAAISALAIINSYFYGKPH